MMHLQFGQSGSREEVGGCVKFHVNTHLPTVDPRRKQEEENQMIAFIAQASRTTIPDNTLLAM